MGKVGIIGDEESILIFKNIGVLIFPASSTEDAYEALKGLKKENYSIIFITETYAKDLLQKIDELEEQIPITPSIVIIPDKMGSSNVGLNKIRECIVRAVGTDLLAKKE